MGACLRPQRSVCGSLFLLLVLITIAHVFAGCGWPVLMTLRSSLLCYWAGFTATVQSVVSCQSVCLPPSLPSLCVYVYTFICGHTFPYSYTCMFMYLCKLDIFLQVLLTWFILHNVSHWPGISNMVGLLASKPQESDCLCLPQCDITSSNHHTWCSQTWLRHCLFWPSCQPVHPRLSISASSSLGFSPTKLGSKHLGVGLGLTHLWISFSASSCP